MAMVPEQPTGPCSRAFIQGRDVMVPCAGIAQAVTVLPVVMLASEMADLLRRWTEGNQGVPYEFLCNAREILGRIDSPPAVVE